MRFARLDLIRYGGFAGRSHDFALGPVDLQVLYGANEAGKSTTLQAIGDLLFGFPHNKAQDWRFDAAQLRVGALIERDGAQLEVVRRRGTRQTLLTGDGTTPTDENQLLRWLGGVDRVSFERLWSLDHQRLRLGGETMARFEDDLGQQLLAAGFGLENVQAVLDKLETEAGTIWKKHGRGTKLNELKNRLTEARNRLSAAEKDSQRWITLNRESDEIEEALTELQTTLRTKMTERSALERLTRVRADLERHAFLAASLNADTPPLFSLEAHKIFDERLAQLIACQQEIDRQISLRDGLLTMRSACIPDPVLLEHESSIDDLRLQHARLAPLRDSWPAQEQKLANLDISLRSAGQRGSYSDILAALPEPDLLARLRPLAMRHDILVRRESEARAARLSAEERLALATARLGTQDAPPLAPLLIALQQAEKRDGIDAELASLDRDIQQAVTIQAQSLRDLVPWRGTIDDLRNMAAPDHAFLDQQSLSWRDTQTRHDALQDSLENIDHALARQNLAKSHLEQRQIISFSALKEARTQRDARFATLMLAPDDQTARTDFIDAQDHADALSDRRFDEAEESARLTQIEQELERLALEQDQTRRQISDLATARDAAARHWYDELAQRGLPQLEPERLRSWLALRERALTMQDNLQQLLARKAERNTQRQAALTTLHDALPDMPYFDTVSDALIWAQARRQSWQKEIDHLAQNRADIDQEQRSLNSEIRKSDMLAAEQAALARDWAQETHGYPGLPLLSAEALDRLATLRHEAAEATHLQALLDAQKHDAKVLDEAIISFATGLDHHHELARLSATDCLEGLTQGLQTARTDRDKVKSWDIDLARNASALNKAQAAIQQIRNRFIEFAQHLPEWTDTDGDVDSATIETLRTLFHREKAHHAAQAEKASLEQRIAPNSDEPGLDALHAQARALPPDMITLRLAEIAQDYEAAERSREEKLKRHGEISTHLRQIEQAHGARDAALDIETCRTEMAQAAETWATARIQSMILTHVARRQRDENTNPLLKSAESIFRALTCGRYRKLTIAEDGKAPELAALLEEDETMIRPGAMSEGTRDQLFLSLRLAALEQAQARGVTLPFIADDLFITFDEVRAAAGFKTLAALAQHNQILFLTHHAHLADMAHAVGAMRHCV